PADAPRPTLPKSRGPRRSVPRRSRPLGYAHPRASARRAGSKHRQRTDVVGRPPCYPGKPASFRDPSRPAPRLRPCRTPCHHSPPTFFLCLFTSSPQARGAAFPPRFLPVRERSSAGYCLRRHPGSDPPPPQEVPPWLLLHLCLRLLAPGHEAESSPYEP